jgi:hypothetical protein
MKKDEGSSLSWAFGQAVEPFFLNKLNDHSTFPRAPPCADPAPVESLPRLAVRLEDIIM